METLKNKCLIPVLVLTGLLSASCEDLWNRCVDGNGNRTADNRTLQSFSRVQVNGDFEVQIDTGSISSAIVEADENLLDYIVTHVSGNMLIIETRNGTCLRPSHPIEITINTQALDEITLNGSGFVYCYGLETEELSINLAGSGQIECYEAKASVVNVELEGSGLINSSLVTENLTTQLEGSGEIKLSGASVNADHKIIGSGHINAGQVITDVCVVYISGSGVVDTHVNNALDVTIIGSGIVYYTGNPILESYISGSGKVIAR
jgi:hypothetical protein